MNYNFEEEELIPNSAQLSREVRSENSFKKYNSKVNWAIFILICLFTLGSWIDISGVWCELPFMIDQLPEGWRLPSILSAISQTAQIGPFIYMIMKLFFPKRIDTVKVIYIIFFIGSLSCFLLAFLWNKYIIIKHERRSIYLYILNFTLSLLDGMSTLTFLPYIGEHFTKEYIIPNYVGESLSSLIPGILAIIQGYKQEDDCVLINNNNNYSSNSNTNKTLGKIQQVYQPRFSVFVYFLLMFILLLISIASFSILNFSKYARKARKNKLTWINLDLPSTDELEDESVYQNREIRYQMERDNNKKEIQFLYLITFIVTFIYYGFLPGLLSYSTIPYSNKFFHLSINLSNILLPFSILFSIWSYEVSIRRIVVEAAIPIIISFYIYIISVMSPCPLFVNSEIKIGGYIIVVCWVTTSCMFMRVRCLIATRIERYGKNILFTLGAFTIFGQVIGGLLIYFLVDVLRFFRDKPKCAPDNLCF